MGAALRQDGSRGCVGAMGQAGGTQHLAESQRAGGFCRASMLSAAQAWWGWRGCGLGRKLGCICEGCVGPGSFRATALDQGHFSLVVQMKFHLQPWLLWGLKCNIFCAFLFVFLVIEDWLEHFVITSAIWIVWKSSLSYWPYWSVTPDVFLYTAVKQEVEPKPKIDLNHCYVKKQKRNWIIIFLWLHRIQIIIGHSWIQPKLKANQEAHRLAPHFWRGETLRAMSLHLVMSAANTAPMPTSTPFYCVLCMCAYICICVCLSRAAVYTKSLRWKRQVFKKLLIA